MKQKLFIECMCSDPSHLLYFEYDEEYDEIWVNNQMNHYLPWYKRVYVAIKFILKFNNKYNSHWDGSMLDKDTKEKLRDFLNNCKKD